LVYETGPAAEWIGSVALVHKAEELHVLIYFNVVIFKLRESECFT
jgi:hypothetical protein